MTVAGVVYCNQYVLARVQNTMYAINARGGILCNICSNVLSVLCSHAHFDGSLFFGRFFCVLFHYYLRFNGVLASGIFRNAEKELLAQDTVKELHTHIAIELN